MVLGDRGVSTGSKRDGYPCPHCNATLMLIKGGAWCPECKTVWREADEVSLRDLDGLPETAGEQ